MPSTFKCASKAVTTAFLSHQGFQPRGLFAGLERQNGVMKIAARIVQQFAAFDDVQIPAICLRREDAEHDIMACDDVSQSLRLIVGCLNVTAGRCCDLKQQLIINHARYSTPLTN